MLHPDWFSFVQSLKPTSVLRFAPTPSGFLHIGNGANFVLVWLFARSCEGAKIMLRIDDLDKARKRPEYVDDIFNTLDWLGLDYDFGPSDTADFEAHWSQELRLEMYQKALTSLRQTSLLFPCKKSRKDLAPYDAYPKHFRQQTCTFEDKNVAWRAKGNDAMGIDDFIVRKKDKRPSYQLASLIDDLYFGISHVVRGCDLEESTTMQLYLAEISGNFRFLPTHFWHHPLLLDENRNKLSKSDGAIALKTLQESGQSPSVVFQAALRMLGFETSSVKGASSALDFFQTELNKR